MVVGVRLMATPFAERKVLFPVVRNDAVGNAVSAKTVENTVNRCPVYTVADGSQDFVVAESGARLFKGG